MRTYQSLPSFSHSRPDPHSEVVKARGDIGCTEIAPLFTSVGYFRVLLDFALVAPNIEN